MSDTVVAESVVIQTVEIAAKTVVVEQRAVNVVTVGIQGPPGAGGSGGSGIPDGGNEGDVLVKNSSTDGDANWRKPTWDTF